MKSEQPEQPILNIIGEKVALGPWSRDLLPLFLKWMNDFEVMHTYRTALYPMTREAAEAWYDRHSRSEREVALVVYERATMRPLGHTELSNIDRISRAADFSIFIGEKDSWGEGYGTEATALTLDYAFNGLSLHSVLLRTRDFNERSIRAYTRAGFRVIGRWREAYRVGERAGDMVLMDCLATEFESPVLHRLFEKVPRENG
jgi:RimJ/RimL family protein N-acetyltransferase